MHGQNELRSREKYEQLKKFGDRLSDMKTDIGWKRIGSLLGDLYTNDTERAGDQTLIPYSWSGYYSFSPIWSRGRDHGDRTIQQQKISLNALETN